MKKRFFNISKLSSILLFLWVALQASLVSASDLDGILNSKEMERYKRASNELSPQAGLDPGSNLQSLFSAQEDSSYIDLWLEVPTGNFTLQNSKGRSADGFKHSLRNYISKQGVYIEWQVLVPHPRQEEAARFRLLKEFAELTPPRIKVKFIEDITVAARKANLLTLPDGSCQVNIDLTRGALTTFKSKCENTKTILEFIELTSLDRFEQKLDS